MRKYNRIFTEASAPDAGILRECENFRYIVFDLDGTLVNSKEGITKCVQYALARYNIYENDPDLLEHFIGPPLTDEFIKTYGFSREQALEATETYRERYEPVGIYEAELYDGVDKMLGDLKRSGRILSVATSKPQMMAEKVLEHFNIMQYFSYVTGSQRNGPRQSKEDVLKELFRIMELEPSAKDKTVLIGDTDYDVAGAEAVGISCVGAGYGFGKPEDLISGGALCVVSNPSGIAKLFGTADGKSGT